MGWTAPRVGGGGAGSPHGDGGPSQPCSSLGVCVCVQRRGALRHLVAAGGGELPPQRCRTEGPIRVPPPPPPRMLSREARSGAVINIGNFIFKKPSQPLTSLQSVAAPGVCAQHAHDKGGGGGGAHGVSFSLNNRF